MLTLKKVKELVEAPSHAKRTPSPKMLFEEGIVLLRREFDQGSHLTVYNSGYVLFSAGKRNTVFHIHDCCGDYAYDAAEGKGDVIEEEYFENCEWHIRALFEGERKMEDNQAKCEGAGRSNVCVSYHALSEDWSEIADRTINMLEKIIENTSPTVIKAMYEALGNMGLSKGNVLEPSCGVGNFMGLVPDSMEKIRMYGVELDSISGRIAQQLYQKNKIAVQGFETMQFPDSFFDCVVGNVPFGNYKVPDKRYDRHNFLIHDYFIAKSLDLVRPGGVVAVVTSSGTLDKKDSSVREYLANRADLVGAVRLPNNAFQRNANTGVVADILFLQKRDRAAVEQADWVDLGETLEGYSINQYFAKHPEMVLGEITTESTQYGKQETTVKPIEGADLAQQLKEAVGNIHATITEPEISDDELDVQEEPIPADPSVKNFSFTNVDGQIYYRENSFMNKVELPAVTAERVLGMIALRETTRKLLDCQLHDGSDVFTATVDFCGEGFLRQIRF